MYAGHISSDGHHNQFGGIRNYVTQASEVRVDVVDASRAATRRGQSLGVPISACDPGALGIHDSFTLPSHSVTGLTRYIERAHDAKLRKALARLTMPEAASLFVIAEGTSCSGKTRALYEAVRVVLPTWLLIAPRSAADLGRLLVGGVPARTVIWLDELQSLLTVAGEGPTVADYLTRLITSDELGVRPVLVAATIWPANLAHLRQRPDPASAALGAGAVQALLETALVIPIAETFSSFEMGAARVCLDPRVRAAARDAQAVVRPEQGWKVTQVLAGGTSLVDRLYPPKNRHIDRAFSPAARALIEAAADLRMAGMTEPLPYWALEASASAYLNPPDLRPANDWLPYALAEATRDAENDDPLTAHRSHDVYRHGTPGLTLVWVVDDEGERVVAAYNLHDYLLQDRVLRYGGRPFPSAVWRALSRNAGKLDRTSALNLANRAKLDESLGKSIALDLVRDIAERGDWHARKRVLDRLVRSVKEGDPQALADLRAVSARWGEEAHVVPTLAALAKQMSERASAGDAAALSLLRRINSEWSAGAAELARALGARASRRDEEALQELLVLARDVGAARRHALTALASLAEVGDSSAPEHIHSIVRLGGVDRTCQIHALSVLAELGDNVALDKLRSLTGGGTKSYVRVLAHLALGGDEEALAELKAAASTSGRARSRLKQVLLHTRHSDVLRARPHP